jgi:hypothetical protein
MVWFRAKTQRREEEKYAIAALQAFLSVFASLRDKILAPFPT